MSQFLYNLSTTRVTVLSLILFFLFLIMVLPHQAETAAEETGSTLSPDTSFYYSPARLYSIAETYGTQGRRAYIQHRFTFDLIFPLVYTFFLTASLSQALRRLMANVPRALKLNLIPVLGMTCDYLENLSTSLVMAAYPQQLLFIARLAGIFTLMKWVFIGASFFLLIGPGIYLLGRETTRLITPGGS